MAQPEYVPVAPQDLVRITERLPLASSWVADRPGDIARSGVQPKGKQIGVPGPDQGYMLTLAEHLRSKLVLGPEDHGDDAVAGCTGVALRRAALYGRAPVIHDMELAFTLWGFMAGAPKDLIDYRRPMFGEVAHNYAERRAIADAVPETTLRLKPTEVAGRLTGGWREMLGLTN